MLYLNMASPATELTALVAGLLGVLAALVGRTHLLCREGKCACSLNEPIPNEPIEGATAQETDPEAEAEAEAPEARATPAPEARAAKRR
jgi:hypothetical protein